MRPFADRPPFPPHKIQYVQSGSFKPFLDRILLSESLRDRLNVIFYWHRKARSTGQEEFVLQESFKWILGKNQSE